MKKSILMIAALLLASFSTPVHANEKDVVAEVNGMVCDFCAQSLSKVFGKEDSVNDINVSLDTQTVTIDVKDGKTLRDEKIKELIEWGGYELVSIKRN